MSVEGTQSLEFLGLPAIVASPGMRALLELTARVARSPAAVLITGESGVGKELIARAIHHYSMRCSRPWVDLNCGALPEHLLESELFGYERGAFSGAMSAKPGLFELAHTGTLFLDEVGELEPRMQVKLLRVLDGTPYYRLGATKKVQVDVRVVAATNSDLEQEVRAGRFRGDLYHRLSQVVLRVPPLRERREDIGPLAEYFLSELEAGSRLAGEAAEALRRYDWPGNVRELRNVIMRAVIASAGGVVGVDHLGLPMRPVPVEARAACPHRLDGVERETILRVLGETQGHRQRAAAILGISRRTLSRKLKQYRSAGPESLAGGEKAVQGGLDGNWRHDAELSGKTA